MGGLYRSPTGETVEIDDPRRAEFAVSQGGYVPVSEGQRLADLEQEAITERGNERGVLGGLNAFLTKGASALTLGGSDAFLGATIDPNNIERLKAEQEYHPYLSTAGTVTGLLGAGLAAPESLLARTPAGLASRAGAEIAGLGEGAGVLGQAGYAAAGAAVEGAAQNAGAYISDVALGDKDLSADGFMGAMGKGALWGGVAGGALTLASGGLQAARELFPRQEMTREAVEGAREVAQKEISSLVDDSKPLAQATRSRLQQLREEKAALDVSIRKRLADVEVETAQKLAAQDVAQAEAKTAAAQARAEAAQARAERASAPRATRKALKAEEDAGTESAATATVEGAGDTATPLERQLRGTKAGLDSGLTLQQIAEQQPKIVGLPASRTVEDALNAEIAKVDPEAARLVHSLDQLEQGADQMSAWLGKYGGEDSGVARFDRSQAARAWADEIRPKEAGYYTRVPEGEGNPFLARGSETVWRGSDAERQLADDITMSKVSPEERLAAEDALSQMAQRRKMAEDIAADIHPRTIDEQIREALNSKVDDVNEDVLEGVDNLGRFEAAHAELTDALGSAAPRSSQVRTAALREAQAASDEGAAEAMARAASDTQKAVDTIGLPGGPPVPKRHGLLSVANDIGTAAEALRMMGVDLPDPRNLPVIGPALGAYLRLRVLGRAFGRRGGLLAQTAEGAIASKAAATKQRVYAVVDRMFGVTSNAAAAVAPKSGGGAALLAHSLFSGDDKRPTQPYTSEPKVKADLPTLFLARSDEVGRAMEPGAIRDAVRSRIRTTDPTIVDAIVAAQERKFQFLDSKMPKPMSPVVNPKVMSTIPWVPSQAAIKQWARYVEAAEDPAGVLEGIAEGGHVSVEAVETLKTVYPKLYAEGQRRVVERVIDATEPVPYAQRVRLSLLWDVPIDESMTPEGAAFRQRGYSATIPKAMSPASLGRPTVTSDVQMSVRADPSTKEL